MSYEDLPLFPEAERRPPRAGVPAAPPPRPLDAPAPRAPSAPPPGLDVGRAFRAQPARRPAGLGSRLLATLLDLVAVGALLGLSVLGAGALGATVGTDLWAPVALLATVLSYLYTTLPLAFWGQTPGMAAAGIVARSPGNRPLSFRQAALRWLATLVTVALAGLPALPALAGASLADRASGSATLHVR